MDVANWRGSFLADDFVVTCPFPHKGLWRGPSAPRNPHAGEQHPATLRQLCHNAALICLCDERYELPLTFSDLGKYLFLRPLCLSPPSVTTFITSSSPDGDQKLGHLYGLQGGSAPGTVLEGPAARLGAKVEPGVRWPRVFFGAFAQPSPESRRGHGGAHTFRLFGTKSSGYRGTLRVYLGVRALFGALPAAMCLLDPNTFFF